MNFALAIFSLIRIALLKCLEAHSIPLVVVPGTLEEAARVVGYNPLACALLMHV